MDLADPELYASPERHSMWRRFVADDAVVWSAPGASPGGFWSVFSHQACTQVLRPEAPFTSSYGMLIGFDAEHPDRGGGRMVVASDGEHHAHLRHLITPHLSRSAADAFGRFMQQGVDALLADARRSPIVDVAQVLAPRLPAMVVCELLGVPPAERDHLIEATNHAFAGADSSGDGAASTRAHTDIFLFFHELVARRRERPTDDLTTALLRDPRLAPDDVLINLYNLLIGGNQTSRHVIAGCFHAASVATDLLPSIRRDPDMIHLAVEEVLRWVSPGMHVLRVATEDLELDGTSIVGGQAVVAWLAAGNRDPRVFADPDRFDPRRRPNRHLSFGHGRHLCLGANVARLEVQTILKALAANTEAVRVVGEPQPTRSNLVQGYRELHVEIDWLAEQSGDGPSL